MTEIMEPPSIEPDVPDADTPTAPRKPRPKGPGLKARFKRMVWRLADRLGDEDFAAAFRDDLNYQGRRFGSGMAIPETTSDIFRSFSEGIDPNLDSLKSTFGDIAEFVDDFKEMVEAAVKAGDDPRFYWDVVYYYIKVATMNAVKYDSPFVYGLARLLTFVSENAESYETFDPARFMAVLRGEAGAATGTPQSASQVTMDRVAAAIALGAGIAKIVWDATLAESLRGKLTYDYYYGWELIGEETEVADRIAARTLTVVFGAGPVADDAETRPLLAGPDGDPETPEGDDGAAPFRVAATLALVDDQHGGAGFIVSFSGDAGFVHAGENFELEARIGAAGGAAQFIGLRDGPPSRPVGGALSPFGKLAFTVKPPGDTSDEPASGTRLEFRTIGVDVEAVEGVAAAILRIDDAALIIDPEDAGRLLRALFGDATRIDFGVRVRWDTVNGLHIDGGSGLRVVRTVEKPLLPGLQIQQLTLALGAHPDDPALAWLEVSAALATKLGGWAVTVERMGLIVDIGYDEASEGSPFAYRPRFKAPSGVGMQLRLANFDGGGYLYLDPAAGEYAGALQLQWSKFALKALAAYRDGAERDSFIAFLFGEFPPLTLLPCLYLTGVGGMFGINHTIDIEALEAGLRGGVLEDLMFPPNPVADAPRILNRIRTVFPLADSARGRTLVAMIMARLSLGTPEFATLKLAYLVERFKTPGGGGVSVAVRRVILMELAIRRPRANPNFQLIVDAVVHFEPQERSGGFTGRLRDSRIGRKHPIAITGMAVGRWGIAAEGEDQKSWLISVGGFHPAFTEVPAGLPLPIERIGAKFSAGPAEILLELYIAFGTATLQFGLNAFVQIRSGSIALLGRIGFDALVDRRTDRWDAVGFGSFVLRYKDEDLCGIELSYRWAGPDPSELGGTCSFNLLGWKQEFSFLTTWGDDVAIPSQFSDSAEFMRAELANRANWEARLPRGVPPTLTFAAPTEGGPVAAHPLGCLQFSQTRIPFELELQRIGATAVRGPTRFSVEGCRLGKRGIAASAHPTDELFPLAEYRNLNESDVLARPQLERLQSGCRFGGDGYSAGAPPPDQALACQTLYLDPEANSDHPFPPIALREPGKSRPDLNTVAGHARHGGVGRAPVRRNARLVPPRSPRFRVTAVPLAMARKDELRAAGPSLSAAARRSPTLGQAEIRKAGAAATVRLVEAWELGLGG